MANGAAEGAPRLIDHTKHAMLAEVALDSRSGPEHSLPQVLDFAAARATRRDRPRTPKPT
jgi:hypothetical protein